MKKKIQSEYFREIRFKDEKQGYKAKIVEGILKNGAILTYYEYDEEKGSEYYSGPNYTQQTARKSYSRRWDFNNLPSKWYKQILELKSLFDKKYLKGEKI